MQVMFLMGRSQIELNGDNYPLYLTEIDGELILEKQVNSFADLKPRHFLFCVTDQQIKHFQVESVIRQLAPASTVVPVHADTQGAVCTALLGIEHINTDEELMITSINDFISDDVKKIAEQFREQKADVGVISFNSIHPRYSFAKLDGNGNVIEFAEKRPISKNALASLCYFKKGGDFVECAMDVVRKDNPINDAFYISQVHNEMILRQKKVVLYKIADENYHPLKTEQQLAQYVSEWKETKGSR